LSTGRSGTMAIKADAALGSIWIVPIDRPDSGKELFSKLSERDGFAGIAWLSDTRVAFTRGGGIWSRNVDGTEDRRLIDEGWSPTSDPQRGVIFFVRNVPSNPRRTPLFSMPISGGPETQITEKYEGFGVTTSGGSLFFVEGAPESGASINVTPVSGGPSVQLYRGSPGDYIDAPMASPDGQWLIVNDESGSNADSPWRLVTRTGSVWLTSIPPGFRIEEWWPDGKALLVWKDEADGTTLFRAGFDPGTRVVGPPRPFLKIERGVISNAAFSPDGSRLAFHRSWRESNVVLVKPK
jgi:Tol biopolymer transport system component